MSGNIACRQGPNFWDGQTLYDTHVIVHITKIQYYCLRFYDVTMFSQ